MQSILLLNPLNCFFSPVSNDQLSHLTESYSCCHGGCSRRRLHCLRRCPRTRCTLSTTRRRHWPSSWPSWPGASPSSCVPWARRKWPRQIPPSGSAGSGSCSRRSFRSPAGRQASLPRTRWRGLLWSGSAAPGSWRRFGGRIGYLKWDEMIKCYFKILYFSLDILTCHFFKSHNLKHTQKWPNKNYPELGKPVFLNNNRGKHRYLK